MPLNSAGCEAMDFTPLCSSMLQERCTLQELNSSDDDSEVSVNSSLASEDLFFEELNAYLGGNSDWAEELAEVDPALMNECEGGETDLLRSMRLSPSDIYDLLMDERVDFPSVAEAMGGGAGDSSNSSSDRLYHELQTEIITPDNDFVVLGVGLQTLSSGLCDDSEAHCLCSSAPAIPSYPDNTSSSRYQPLQANSRAPCNNERFPPSLNRGVLGQGDLKGISALYR